MRKHRSNLLNYIIFLRITPFLPNWFINITSPVINVPLMPFFFGTVIGKLGTSADLLQYRKINVDNFGAFVLSN